MLADSALRPAAASAQTSDFVDLTSAQTITGVKTFTKAPLVPTSAWLGDGRMVPGIGFADAPTTGWGNVHSILGKHSLSFIAGGLLPATLMVDSAMQTFIIHSRASNRMQLQSSSAIVFIAHTGHFEFETSHPTNPVEVIGYRSGSADGRTIVFRTDPSTVQAVPLAAEAPPQATVNTFEIRAHGGRAVSWFDKDGIFVGPVATNSQPASYVLALLDAGKVLEMNAPGPNTVTVPPASAVGFPVGTVIDVYQHGQGRTTIKAGAGVTVRSPDGMLSTRTQYSSIRLRIRATNEWVLSGDLVTAAGV